LDKVENLKLCQPLESSEADTDDDEFKEGGNIKLWGAFVFRKRVKYQIGDAIFVRKTGSDKQEAEQMEYEGNPLYLEFYYTRNVRSTVKFLIQVLLIFGHILSTSVP
jgi:hypothetical protein